MLKEKQPTPYPDINALLGELLTGVRRILGPHLIGMYLDGSLASGDFDEDSDIDFVVVCDEAVTDEQFARLYDLHERMKTVDPLWGIQLEGSYLPLRVVRRTDPDQLMQPNMERGADEHLKLACHDATWDVHRWALRERGITLVGPEPETLVDPVSAEDLRRAMRVVNERWLTGLLADPGAITHRGYQSYIVLSLCRMWYTMQTGKVASKPEAVRWAKENLDRKWGPLIEDAWVGRHQGGEPPDAERVAETMAMVKEIRESVFGG